MFCPIHAAHTCFRIYVHMHGGCERLLKRGEIAMSRFGLQNGELVWARNPYRQEDPVWWPVRAPPPSEPVLKYGSFYKQCALVSRICASLHRLYQMHSFATVKFPHNTVCVFL